MLSWLGSILDFSIKHSDALIGLSALFLAVWQGVLQRSHNRLSVIPHLSFDRIVQNAEPQMKLTLSNHGIGPALITSFEVNLDDEPVLCRRAELWKNIASQLRVPILWGGGKVFASGDAVPPGQSCDVFIFKTSHNEKDANFVSNRAHAELDRIKVVVKYKSVYGRTFSAVTELSH